jgi:hypothetical protein
MATKHWIRDVDITFTEVCTAGLGKIDYVWFHFLRNAGWDWLWECDGYAGNDPNRIPDGNMEASDTASWSTTGSGPPVLSKVTSPVHSGERALSVQSVSTGDGVVSSDLTSMENSTKYHLAIWALNNTGQPWTVSVDIGTGYTVVGTIPHGGSAFTLNHFDFTTAVSGTRKIKIEDLAGALGTIYVSDILIIKSYFEYNAADAWRSGVDGVTINPNQFSSPSYNFVAGDIGKILCVWDPINNKNSGAYAITAAAGGVATLNLRSGTATLTGASGLSWRMIDLTAAPNSSSDTGKRTAGFGLQSPHSSKWRLFIRQDFYNSTYDENCFAIWSSPVDTDFDFSTGTFYKTGPSTQNPKGSSFTLWTNYQNDWPGMHLLFSGGNTAGSRRMYLMTDEDASFVSLLVRDVTGGTGMGHDTFVAGYLGADSYHPGIQEWGLLARWQNAYAVGNKAGIYFDGYYYRFSGQGTCIGPDGLTQDLFLGQYGYSTAGLDAVTQTNAAANRWSGKEWIHNPVLVRASAGEVWPSERVMNVGMFQGRQNMAEFTTFDSNAYLHTVLGWCWEWMGESVLV